MVAAALVPRCSNTLAPGLADGLVVLWVPSHGPIRALRMGPATPGGGLSAGWTPPRCRRSLVRRLGSLRLRSLILRCLFLRNRCCSVAILRRLPAEWSMPKSRITVWIGGSLGLMRLASSLWMVLSVTMKAVLWLLTTNPTPFSPSRS